MRRKIHIRLDIRGALKNFKKREWNKVITTDDGKLLNADEAKDFFIDCIAKGWKYLPFGECDSFSYETGCPGHEVKEESVA